MASMPSTKIWWACEFHWGKIGFVSCICVTFLAMNVTVLVESALCCECAVMYICLLHHVLLWRSTTWCNSAEPKIGISVVGAGWLQSWGQTYGCNTASEVKFPRCDWGSIDAQASTSTLQFWSHVDETYMETQIVVSSWLSWLNIDSVWVSL